MKSQENIKQWSLSIPFTFSTVVMALCVYKLIAGVPDNERALYWGGLCSVLAYWLPSPIRLADNNTSSAGESDRKSQELISGLQIIARPANTTVEAGSPNTTSPLRHPTGDRQTW